MILYEIKPNIIIKVNFFEKNFLNITIHKLN